jgi:hypothetical protein
VSDLAKLYDRAKDISDRADALSSDLDELAIGLDRAPEIGALRLLTTAAMASSRSLPQVTQEPSATGSVVLVIGIGSDGVYVRAPGRDTRPWLGPLGVPGKPLDWHEWSYISCDRRVRLLYTPSGTTPPQTTEET